MLELGNRDGYAAAESEHIDGPLLNSGMGIVSVKRNNPLDTCVMHRGFGMPCHLSDGIHREQFNSLENQQLERLS